MGWEEDLRGKDWAKFPPISPVTKSIGGPKAVLIAIMGPPGSGKTRSMLEMMRGAQKVFGGPAVLIDTEAGRSKKYSPKEGQPAQPDNVLAPTYDFERIDLDAPFRGDRCWAAIKLAMARKPAAIGFDNLSDEHSGEGGYLWWHDAEVERVGGNEWGAWARPSAARKKLLTGISHVYAPPILFFTFIAEEKTDQVEVMEGGRKKKKVINKGWTPVAPMLFLKTMDLTVILPWDSKGTPIWETRHLPGEDFMRKWPAELTALLEPGQITENHGEALARWAKGDAAKPASQTERPAGAADVGPNEAALVDEIKGVLRVHNLASSRAAAEPLMMAFGQTWAGVTKLPADQLRAGLATLKKNLDGLAAMKAEMPEREPGEDTSCE